MFTYQAFSNVLHTPGKENKHEKNQKNEVTNKRHIVIIEILPEDSRAGAGNQWFSKRFSFKNGNIVTPPKSKTSEIPEPKLEINGFQKNFLFKMVTFKQPPKSRESGIPEPELEINDFQKLFFRW